jgi:hypothetical protein
MQRAKRLRPRGKTLIRNAGEVARVMAEVQ